MVIDGGADACPCAAPIGSAGSECGEQAFDVAQIDGIIVRRWSGGQAFALIGGTGAQRAVDGRHREAIGAHHGKGHGACASKRIIKGKR